MSKLPTSASGDENEVANMRPLPEGENLDWNIHSTPQMPRGTCMVIELQSEGTAPAQLVATEICTPSSTLYNNNCPDFTDLTCPSCTHFELFFAKC